MTVTHRQLPYPCINLEKMKKADSLSCRRKQLTLFDFPIRGILANHEGTRRTVHRFSGTAACPPLTSWMRHPRQSERNVPGTSLASRKDSAPCSQFTTSVPIKCAT